MIDCTLPGEACSTGAVPFSGTRAFRRYSFPIRFAGWNSGLFRLIPLAEQGLGTLTDQIDSYPVEQFL